MNENNENNNIKPYKATGNLNTIIGNPNININDTMNINIQSAVTNEINNNNIQSVSPKVPEPVVNNNIPAPQPIKEIQKNDNKKSDTDNNKVNEAENLQNIYFKRSTNNQNNTTTNKKNTNVNQNNAVINPNNDIVNQNNNTVKKTYVSKDNKPKKKNVSFNMGPEFKIALLIIVILLVFIFLLPMLSELIMGY